MSTNAQPVLAKCKKCGGSGERRKGEGCKPCKGSGWVNISRDEDGKTVVTPAVRP